MLHLAWIEASQAFTEWRLHYGMPPNDPRVLEATEEEVLRDLLVLRSRSMLAQEARNPTAAAVDRLTMDRSAADKMVTDARAYLAKEGTKRALRTIARGGKTDEQVEQSNQRVTLRLRSDSTIQRTVKP